tara:strand:- start:498 stop:647 length:150 start_codon:yes stop_codon:yes gene_type:complete
MSEEQLTKTSIKKEIINEFDHLSPTDLMVIFELIFGFGEVQLDEVDWSK